MLFDELNSYHENTKLTLHNPSNLLDAELSRENILTRVLSFQ